MKHSVVIERQCNGLEMSLKQSKTTVNVHIPGMKQNIHSNRQAMP